MQPLDLVDYFTYFSKWNNNDNVNLLNDFDDENDVHIEDDRNTEEDSKIFFLNVSFSLKLLKLEKIAIDIQYQLAYLSTLGGSYNYLY